MHIMLGNIIKAEGWFYFPFITFILKLEYVNFFPIKITKESE